MFAKTITIANITSYFPRKYREAIAIQKHPNNLNRDNGYNINKIWKIILPVIEDQFLSSLPHPQFFSPTTLISNEYKKNGPESGGRSSVSGCSSPLWSGLQDSRNFGIPRMDLDTEETHETHNLYIESTHGSLKNIINYWNNWFLN